MAWTYYCEEEQITLSAPNKEELAQQLIMHMRENHGTEMSLDEVRESVERNAKQSAA